MPKQSKSGSKKTKKAKRSSYQVFLGKFKAKTGKGKGSAKAQYKKYAKSWKGKPAKAKKSKGKGKSKGKSKSKAKKKNGSVSISVKKPGSKRKSVTIAAEKKKPKKKGGGGKKKARKSTSVEALIIKNKAALASVEARYALKLANEKTKLEKASGAEKTRIINNLTRLGKERDAELARITKRQERDMWAARNLQAAEKKKGKKKKKSKAREDNPIGSSGMVEYAAVAGGVLTAIAMTIVPYRLIRSHALQGAPPVDQPQQGDVPNLLTGQLPLWSRLKWKGAVALGVVLVGDIALPLFVASRIKTSDGWKTYFQMWGWTSVALGGTKLVVDVLALATKSTSLGQRLFAPENTARDVRVLSAAAQLPAIPVAPGTGLPGLTSTTGYGKPEAAGCEHVGAGAPCCDSCKQSKHVPRGGATPQQGGNPPETSVPPVQTNPDGTVTSPLPGPGGATPPAGTIPRVPVQKLTPGLVFSNPNAATPGAAGAAGAHNASVTPIANRFQKSRFDRSSKFGIR